MLDAAPSLRALRGPALPVDRLVAGKRVDEVAALLPRLFALCRAAQAAAVGAALGRPVDAGGIGQEVLRDHALKLCVTWPNLLGLGPRPLGAALTDRAALARAIFGPAGRPPATPHDFAAFLASGLGAGPVLAGIAQVFSPGLAVADGLPTLDGTNIWQAAPVENSTAARHVAHPVMRALEASHGRGALWRAAARLYDIGMVLDGGLPPVIDTAPGTAIVPATRGSYAVRIETEGEIVTRFTRVTPTDSLLAPGGILDRALASLPADRAGLGPLLLDILDPCAPVRLEEVRHA